MYNPWDLTEIMASMKLNSALQELRNLRKEIDSTNPAKGEIPKNIRQLSPSTDSKEIMYFNRIKKSVKQNFQQYQQKEQLSLYMNLELDTNVPTGSGAETGKIWHSSIKRYIDDLGKNCYEIGKAVIDALKEWLPGIKFLQSEFPLYGYMVDKEDSETSFWNGKVDAIGWYQDRHVIVDWKAVDLLGFWEKNKDAYGKYLHQCVLYARLLKLHLSLPKLPYILIVPISNQTGKDIAPGLFSNVPEECLDELNQYHWSKEPKEPILSLPRMMFSFIPSFPFVDERSKLREVFRDDCTVKELLDALGFLKLRVDYATIS